MRYKARIMVCCSGRNLKNTWTQVERRDILNIKKRLGASAKIKSGKNKANGFHW
jgi:hypothetical protein